MRIRDQFNCTWSGTRRTTKTALRAACNITDGVEWKVWRRDEFKEIAVMICDDIGWNVPAIADFKAEPTKASRTQVQSKLEKQELCMFIWARLSEDSERDELQAIADAAVPVVAPSVPEPVFAGPFAEDSAPVQPRADAQIVQAGSVYMDGNPLGPKPNDSGVAAALRDVLEAVGFQPKAPVDRGEIESIAFQAAENVGQLLRSEFASLVEGTAIRTINITVNAEQSYTYSGLRHCGFDSLLADTVAFRACDKTHMANFLLIGEAGTGKTTAAAQIAEALELPFFFNGAIDSEYKLRGFIDANGRVISTAFRKAYTDGGVYLFDEVDSSLPSACLAFNAALANGAYDFPGEAEPTPRNKNTFVFAAGNTWNGPTGDYVGRYPQDAAFLDRFMKVAWELDEKLERSLCVRKDWHDYVARVRGNIRKHGIRHIISPRATLTGDVLLASGRPWDRAVQICVRKGLNDADWTKVTGA